MIVRPFVLQDLLAVVAIDHDASVMSWTSHMFLDAYHAGNRMTVLSVDNVVVGFSVCLTALDEWELLVLAVSPAYQQRGYGRTLLENLIQEGARCAAKKLLLEVRESNTIARKLYASLHFQECARRSAYYRTCTTQREDAIIMALIIS